MYNKLLFLFAVLFCCATAGATDYFVAELEGTTLTFKKTTTAPDNITSWDATNTGTGIPEWRSKNFTSVVIDPSFAEARPTSCSHWFNCYYGNVNSITGLEHLNTSEVTSMNGMFDSITLTSLDLSNFDTSNVTTMSGMFECCGNLTSLNLSSFNTSRVTDMTFMFQECNNLTALDVRSFDTSSVTSMMKMFYNCGNLASVDLTGFNTSNVTDMGEMFANCSSLTALDLSSFDCRNLTNAEGMFSSCGNLQTIYITDGLGNLDHDPISSQWMFTYCYSLSGGAGSSYTSSGAGLSGVVGRIDTGGIGTAYFSPAFSLAGAEDNTSTINKYRNCIKAKVTLADRTLYKDNSWNTICLPFDVDLTDANSPFYGATVKKLDTEAGTYDHVTGAENSTLYLNFKDEATTMTAGTPYIIKWASGDNLANPAFLPVNVNNSTNNVTSSDGKVTFTGTYAPISIASEDKSVLFMGEGNTLYYPDGESTITIGCQRAYFQLSGIEAGIPESGGDIKAFVLNFGDDADGIGRLTAFPSFSAEEWYDLGGRKLQGRPTRHGIYIHNGRKEVLK